MTSRSPKRCPWARPTNELYVRYHDEEWGVPSRDDRHLFEMLILEGAQAGLSWETILNKRANYRRAFHRFDARRVARWSRADIAQRMGDAGIVRNRLKIESAVSNARAFLAVREEFGTFSAYAWRFVDGTPAQNAFRTMREIPPRSPVSDALGKDLKQRGFRFVGSTIMYAWMQACGLVNDHLVGCPRRAACRALSGRR